MGLHRGCNLGRFTQLPPMQRSGQLTSQNRVRQPLRDTRACYLRFGYAPARADKSRRQSVCVCPKVASVPALFQPVLPTSAAVPRRGPAVGASHRYFIPEPCEHAIGEVGTKTASMDETRICAPFRVRQVDGLAGVWPKPFVTAYVRCGELRRVSLVASGARRVRALVPARVG